MTPDQKSEIYNAGYEAGQKHIQPSPATLDMITDLKICQAALLTNLNNLIEVNKDEHALMLTQTTKINGTVASIQKWRFLLTGGMIFSNIVIVPIVLYLIGRLF